MKIAILSALLTLTACAHTVISEPTEQVEVMQATANPECSQDFQDCATYHVVTCARQTCSCTWWIPQGTDQQWNLVPETMTCGLTGWDQAPDASQ